VTSLTATEARQRFFALLKSAAKGHRVYRITHNDGDAVLLSEEDYESLIETLELLSTPGVAKSIRQARREIERGETFSLEDVLGRA
jgi:antitoxin YefM